VEQKQSKKNSAPRHSPPPLCSKRQFQYSDFRPTDNDDCQQLYEGVEIGTEGQLVDNLYENRSLICPRNFWLTRMIKFKK